MSTMTEQITCWNIKNYPNTAIVVAIQKVTLLSKNSHRWSFIWIMAFVACIRGCSSFLTFNPPRLKKKRAPGDDFHFSKPAAEATARPASVSRWTSRRLWSHSGSALRWRDEEERGREGGEEENRSTRLDTPSKLPDMFPRLWKHESF